MNLPDLQQYLKINKKDNTIFDPYRKKYVALQPEEWVRQNFLAFMEHHLCYPKGLLSVEMPISLNGLTRRCDIVAFNKSGKPKLIVECKAPSVKISQKAFTQIATYNLKLNVDYLIVTNGLNHYCCKMNYTENSYIFIEEIPKFQQL